MTKKILNHYGENLDVLIEGNLYSQRNLVFVHGFGTNKNEGYDLFVDVAKELSEYFRIIRFDFSGYGESEGKQEDVCYSKQAYDLDSILDFVRTEYDENISIFAHSMGCFVTSLLSPSGILKTVFSSIPNPDSSMSINRIKKRIENKNGFFDELGISTYPRSSGEVQKIGSQFWIDIRDFQPIDNIREFACKTRLMIIHPKQDEIVGNIGMAEYSKLAQTKFIEINGDHNYSKAEERQEMIKVVKDFLV